MVDAEQGQLTLAEAAALLGVHYMTAYRYVRTGRLAASREGAQWVVAAADVDRLRSQRRTAGVAGGGPSGPSGDAAEQAAEGARRGTRQRVDRVTALSSRMAAGDEPGAWTVVESAMVSGMEPAAVYLELIGPAMRRIGDGWVAGSVSVAEEHRATAVALRLAGRLGPRFARRGRKRGTVVIGAPSGDFHALPSTILRDLLRGAGFEVLDVGANTPAESFAETARGAAGLVAVVVGSTALGAEDALRGTIRALREAGVTVPILVGGSGIADEANATALGADGWSGRDGSSAVAAVEAAVADPAAAAG